jgi:hypothetical protein
MRAQRQARKCEVETKVKGRDAWLANAVWRAKAAFRVKSNVLLFRLVCRWAAGCGTGAGKQLQAAAAAGSGAELAPKL